MMHRIILLLLPLASGALLTTGCGSGSVGTIEGQVVVDGAPVETGTVSFKPAENPTGRGFGGGLAAGRFEIPADATMKPGKYLVAVVAMKATGKTFNDPQRGPVPVLETLDLADSPQEVEITSGNAGQLQLTFATKKK